MPRNDKKAAITEIFHYRIFTRRNLGAKALQAKRAPDTEYLKTMSAVKYAQEWIRQHGVPSNVYLIEKFNAKTQTASAVKMPRQCFCGACALYGPQLRRTFVEKWAWSTAHGWHATGYVLPSEVASIKCVNNGK
jgi:hypothetical protein